MATIDQLAKARTLRADGERYEDIAAQLGVSTSTAHRWLNPDSAARDVAFKRETRDRYAGSCADCGEPTSGKSYRDVSERCVECARHKRRGDDHERMAAESARIRALRDQGLTIAEIAAEMGMTPGALGVKIHRLRRRGYGLPYRRRDLAAGA